ncbi:MAG TPA: transposase [Acidimicrobiales bacterium]|nr:transposase [Acidimicrobiales bacterium]
MVDTSAAPWSTTHNPARTWETATSPGAARRSAVRSASPATASTEGGSLLHRLRRERSVLYRCWQLKEGLRDLYRLRPPEEAPVHLDWWLAWACRSRIPAFVTLSRTVQANRDRILAAVELGLSNSKLEGLNRKIRLINHRGYGHHSATALIAMIYLCCGGITIELPFA